MRLIVELVLDGKSDRLRIEKVELLEGELAPVGMALGGEMDDLVAELKKINLGDGEVKETSEMDKADKANEMVYVAG